MLFPYSISELVIFALAVSASAWYAASAELTDPLRDRLDKRMELARVQARYDAADNPKSRCARAKPGLLDWVNEGLGCRLCVGQWSSWVWYALLAGNPFGSWGSLAFTVAANGLHLGLYQISLIEVSGSIEIEEEGED